MTDIYVYEYVSELGIKSSRIVLILEQSDFLGWQLHFAESSVTWYYSI